MGDPKKLRKKYDTPSHPWQGQRILEENELVKTYGLKNKKEIWKARSVLKQATSQAKKLSGERSEQAKKESEQLLTRLVKLGLLKQGAHLGDVLNVKFEEVLDRRLQTILYKSGLARTVKQARQFVVHGHVMIDGKMMDVPSYFVNVDEQSKISFNPGSAISNPEHSERTALARDAVKSPEEQAILDEKKKKRERKHFNPRDRKQRRPMKGYGAKRN